MHMRMQVDKLYCERPDDEFVFANEYSWAWWYVSLTDSGGIKLGCYLSDIACMRMCGALDSELV